MLKRNNDKKVSLLRYWTTRYFITLCIGLIIIGLISFFWLRSYNLERGLNVTSFLADEISEDLAGTEDNSIGLNADLASYVRERQQAFDIETEPLVYVVDNNGNIVSNSLFGNSLYQEPVVFPDSFLDSGPQTVRIEQGNQAQYLVKSRIGGDDGSFEGWVVIVQPADSLVRVGGQYQLVGILLVSLALLGWLTIYILSKRLLRPIKQIAEAFQRVKEEKYAIRIDTEAKEREIDELVTGFNDMTTRLGQLESMRTELLAGVTHELKTPVTSISGMVQAVKDDVVTGDEAKEFLSVTLAETGRMRNMIADLLEFNTFSSQGVPTDMQSLTLESLLNEVIHQWSISNDTDRLDIQKQYGEKTHAVYTDPMRFQQIMVNLLNNANQAMKKEGTLTIRCGEKNDHMVAIEVIDSGIGIDEEEQLLVFERFYRGENKKYNVHGLGLGLPFSKLIAQGLGGDLYLQSSRPEETVFVFELPQDVPGEETNREKQTDVM
ncbi:Signal transduction histidine kinase [Marinococcus luteus]|uniref:histidine kinase n=1 Tax=Marinococcus luteus TaxID=1122204 RepID=A0A1H2TA48_9BACI|nr:HAMP domain-containing sensor histidine kinase [Marinococcus luteus]SDW40823.1 Signal transduction histidine kinase [Marinococcus luteus]